jgi:uncharacterized membrane protein
MTDIYKAPDANLSQHAETGGYGSLEKGIAGDYEFSIGTVIGEAWQKTHGSKGAFNMAMFLYFILLIAVSVGVQLLTVPLLSAVEPGQPSAPVVVMAIAGQLLINLVCMPVAMGLFMLGLRAAVGANLEATSIFGYFSKMFSLLMTLILMYILIVIGFFLLVLPGIYLMFAYYLAMPLVVEKGLSPWQALEASRKAVTHRWFSVFGLMLSLMVIVLVSAIPLGIGLIWTMPMLIIAYGILYRNIFGVEAASVN